MEYQALRGVHVTATPRFTATLLQPARKGSIQRRCSLLFEVQTDMAVDVEGQGNRTMPEHGLHHLGRHALFQEPGRKGVPRIVQAEGGRSPPSTVSSPPRPRSA